jgi:hypothetical protein
VSAAALARALLPAAFACAVMALTVWLLDLRLTAAPAWLRLAALVPAGAAAYTATLWLCWPGLVRESWEMLRRPRG